MKAIDPWLEITTTTQQQSHAICGSFISLLTVWGNRYGGKRWSGIPGFSGICYCKVWNSSLQRKAANILQETFLTGLQELTPAALKALEHYRVTIGYHRCGAISHNFKAFQALIDAKKSIKRAVAFNYRHYHANQHSSMPWRNTKTH